MESINNNQIVLQKQIVQVEKCVQTDIIIKDTKLVDNTLDEKDDTTNDKDTIIFNRFINDSCIIDDLEYISMRELVYQYKTWSKINSIFNYKDFEQYIESKFIVKKMFNKMFNLELID